MSLSEELIMYINNTFLTSDLIKTFLISGPVPISSTELGRQLLEIINNYEK